ncbi:hypothetical protein [uncultured Aquimarina sp.]|uniref:hypothetical protein n=1 Tax=uncultured Aquimarina sp. TaxID=575652 RepID=UPI002612375A|nr:hypothetical protein [uncultured Aquimarina sp.]
MKRTILFGLAIFICNLIISQDQKKESKQSNAEIFSSKSGTLIEKQYIEIGSIKSTKLKIAKFTDMISGESAKALRFTKTVVSSYSNDTKIASLDIDEVDGLIKSLEIIQESVLNTIPDNYTEITFKSRGGFEAGCYYSKRKNKWIVYYQIEKYGSDSIVRMEEKGLADLLELLKLAKTKLS